MSRVIFALGFALGLAGCDDPSGLGSYSVSVTTGSGAPGSALLLFIGDGLIRVQGAGGTLGWSGEVSGDPGEMRALLIDPDASGGMTFRLFVEDVSAPIPAVSVLQLADRQNERFQPQDTQIRFER